MVPEELAREGWLELGQARIAEEDAREKDTAGKETKNPQEHPQGRLSSSICRPHASLKKLEDVAPTPKGFRE